MKLRVLDDSDRPQFDAFLQAYADTSMFLRSNAYRTGLVYRGAALQAVYVAAEENGRIAGLAAHAWNGMLLVQAPEFLEDVVRTCVESSGRPVTGITGPLDQVRRARVALGMENATAVMDSDETLYSLKLSDLLIPPPLLNGELVCRPPRPEEFDTLYAWGAA